MKIMSFNTQHCLNFVEQKIDFGIMADAILKCGADVVGLNEIRGKGPLEDYTDQTKTLSELTGMEHYFFAPAIMIGGKSPYGNAILSKIPFVSVENITIPDPENNAEGKYYETRCLLKAKLENGYTVLVTHMGLSPEERVNAVKTVMQNLEDEKCILMGDFNAIPTDPVLDPIRERMFDTAELFSEPLLSFDSVEPHCKIDYIFTSRDVKAVRADIPKIIASDHRPHTAEVDAI